MRQHGACRARSLLPRAVGRDLVADDEAAADRVVGARRSSAPVGVEGREAHAVGMERQRLAAVEDAGRASRRRRSRAGRAAAAPCRRGSRRAAAGDRVDVDRVGLVAGEPEQHRLVAAVALAGGAERAVQLACTRARRRRAGPRAAAAARTARAARIGPTVCELDGPMPILKRSKTLTAIRSSALPINAPTIPNARCDVAPLADFQPATVSSGKAVSARPSAQPSAVGAGRRLPCLLGPADRAELAARAALAPLNNCRESVHERAARARPCALGPPIRPRRTRRQPCQRHALFSLVEAHPAKP